MARFSQEPAPYETAGDRNVAAQVKTYGRCAAKVKQRGGGPALGKRRGMTSNPKAVASGHPCPDLAIRYWLPDTRRRLPGQLLDLPSQPLRLLLQFGPLLLESITPGFFNSITASSEARMNVEVEESAPVTLT
jgi:hypothetical protein